MKARRRRNFFLQIFSQSHIIDGSSISVAGANFTETCISGGAKANVRPLTIFSGGRSPPLPPRDRRPCLHHFGGLQVLHHLRKNSSTKTELKHKKVIKISSDGHRGPTKTELEPELESKKKFWASTNTVHRGLHQGKSGPASPA